MAIIIDLNNDSDSDEVPDPSSMRCWISAALPRKTADIEISVQIVDEATMARLNGQFRGKQVPTNVLSFPADLPDELQLPLLGDIAICAQVVNREAEIQGKQPDAHWAHMLVHGTLHLLGYDHIEDADAEYMETLETRIITGLGFPPPYEFTTSGSIESGRPDMTTPSCEK
jgi:probable rRNA maturation factor